MKLDFKSILKPTMVLTIICLIASAALVGTNALTEKNIEKAQLENAENTRKLVMQDADSFVQVDDYYVALKGSEEIGMVFETETKGYGGSVKVMTAISMEGSVTGVSILSHTETPGLGANAEKDSFVDQYIADVPAEGFWVTKSEATQDSEIEALTGATITSNAVTDAVNLAIERYDEVKGGG